MKMKENIQSEKLMFQKNITLSTILKNSRNNLKSLFTKRSNKVFS